MRPNYNILRITIFMHSQLANPTWCKNMKFFLKLKRGIVHVLSYKSDGNGVFPMGNHCLGLKKVYIMEIIRFLF